MFLSLIPLFAGIDRFWGASFKKGGFIDKHHHILSFLAVTLATTLACGLSGSVAPSLFGVGYLFVRTLGFGTFGGSLDPQNLREDLGSWLRFMVALPFWLLAAFIGHWGLGRTAAVFLGVAVLQTVASAWYGRQVESCELKGINLPWDYNILVELLHGAFYGAGMACVLNAR